MIQPARVVLPSSSTPPTGSDNAHSRVLQEHSGNRQTNEYSYTQTVDQKYPVPLLTENTYVVHPAQPPVQHAPSQFYRHAPLPRSHHRSVVNRSQNPYWDPVYQAWCEKQARVLFHRFRSSDQYMKYRSRQQKEDKRGQEEQKWPDRLELAFFQGMDSFIITKTLSTDSSSQHLSDGSLWGVTKSCTRTSNGDATSSSPTTLKS